MSFVIKMFSTFLKSLDNDINIEESLKKWAKRSLNTAIHNFLENLTFFELGHGKISLQM